MPQAMLVNALPMDAMAGVRFAIPFAEIFFVDQVTVAHDEQAAVLAAAGRVVEGIVELGEIHARRFADLGGVF